MLGRFLVEWWLIDNICCFNHARELNAGSFKKTGQCATMRRNINPFGRGMTETMRMEDEVQNREGMISEMDQLPSVS